MSESDDIQQRIAELEATLKLPLPESVRQMVERELATLRAQQPQSAVHGHTVVDNQSQVDGPVTGVNTGTVKAIGPLFTASANGNYIADVIHVYAQDRPQQQADYGAALRRYLEHLYARNGKIDLRGIDDRPMDMPLTDLYISLSLHEPPPDEMRGKWGLRGWIEKVRGWVGQSDESNEQERVKPVDWSMALRHTQIAVIGAPGCGKTTLLQFTAVRLTEILARDDQNLLLDLGLDEQTERPPVPLLLPLREFGAYLDEDECGKRESMGANPALLLECFASYYRRFDLNLPADFFRRLCEAGRALLLLDGLDEVTRSEDRTFVSLVVQEFVTRYPDCRYVVTSRVAAYQGDARIGAGFRICTVADLDSDQQQRFIQNWSRSLHRLVYDMTGEPLDREAGRYARDLWEALQPNQRVRDLASNPLLLTVVAVIYWNKYQLPEDRASLYEESVEVLLRGGRGKADRAAQERARLAMGLNQRREVLAAVAYQMHQQGEEGLLVSRTDLTSMVAAYLHQRGEQESLAHLFVAELPVHIGLLDEREPDRYRFSHLSFQEFMAARHVAETDGWDDLLEHYRETWWREVILLCAGHLSSERCWRFLGQLLDRGERDGIEGYGAALKLTADALGELEKFKGEGPLKERVIAELQRILNLSFPEASITHRIAAAQVLGDLGDPRFPITPDDWQEKLTDLTSEPRTPTPYWCHVPAGTYRIGGWKEGEEGADIRLPAFWVARYPVTVAQYRVFIEAGGYDTERWWTPLGWQWKQRENRTQPWGWNDSDYNGSNQPVIGITWYEAMAFACWLDEQLAASLPEGYTVRLPTEAEWEAAAAHDRQMQRRTYPWGNEPEPTTEHAIFKETNLGKPAPVGCCIAGAAACGALDMAGNVWELTTSSYKGYPGTSGVVVEDFKTNEGDVPVRGQSYYGNRTGVRGAARLWDPPDHDLRHDNGVRLFVSPQPS